MIVADKPAESWTDEDVTGFEIKLSDIARRFKNLEALQNEVAARQLEGSGRYASTASSTGEGLEARRITVTRPDGQEVNQIIWLNHERQDQIECLFDKILGILSLYDNTRLQQAVVAKLVERVLGSASQDNNGSASGKASIT